MSKAQRKNVTRIKIKAQRIKQKEKRSKYIKSAYRTVLVISNDITTQINGLVDQKIVEILCMSGNTFYVQTIKNKSKILFVGGNELTDHELAVAIRSCDVIVYVCNNEEGNEKIEFYNERAKNLMVFFETREQLKSMKKCVGDVKNLIAGYELLINSIFNTKERGVVRRPLIVPSRFTIENEVLICEAFLEKGLVTNSFILNGIYTLKAIEINGQSDKEIEMMDGKEVDMENNDEEMVIEEEKENYDNNLNRGMRSIYKKYKNLDDVNEEPPNYIKKMKTISNLESFEGSCNKNSKRIFVGETVELKFCLKGLNLKHIAFISLSNLFEAEGCDVIYNLSFCSKDLLLNGENLLIDLGVCTVSRSVIVSKKIRDNCFKVVESSKIGFLTFIAPLFINVGSITIYKNTEQQLRFNNFLCYAGIESHENAVIVEEHRFFGSPCKINKKYSTIKNMFTNKEDVEYFGRMEVKSGKFNKGIIKEPVGTHGLFKAYFNKPVKHGEDVTMSVYKRVYPLLDKQ